MRKRIAQMLMAIIAMPGVVALPASAEPDWRDGSSRQRPGQSGVQPYRVPQRYDSEARREESRYPLPAGRYGEGQRYPMYDQRDRHDPYYRSVQGRQDERGRNPSLPPTQLHRSAPKRGVNDVINMVERRYGGKVVGVDDGGDHYRVRLLQRDGRVRTLQVPAEGY